MGETMPEKVRNEEAVKGRPRIGEMEYVEEDMIDLGAVFAVLRKNFWRIAGISLGVGVLTFLYMFTKPNLYRSAAVIMPAEEESRQSAALGALSSLGIQVGGPTKVEDLEVLFRSDDLTVRVFSRHDHWATILGDSYDPKTGTVQPGMLAFLSSGRKEPGSPGDWDAIRAAEDAKRVSLNRKSGSLTVSFESTSPQESAAILTEYLDEAKNRLQEEAFARAAKNKKFIEEQIGKTVDPLTRDRLYSLLGQEVEREMMARNREQFGFRVIDSPRVPDRKSWPSRIRVSFLAIVMSVLIIGIYTVLRERRQLVETG